MRLIDADALEKKFKEMGLGEHSLVERLFADGVFAIIENAPTVDAAPVVRCKDCISSYEFGDLETGEKIRYCQRLRDYWTKDELWVNDDCFCCWGRKRNDVETR